MKGEKGSGGHDLLATYNIANPATIKLPVAVCPKNGETPDAINEPETTSKARRIFVIPEFRGDSMADTPILL